MARLSAELCARGKKPYVIPVGGSNSVGAIGYLAAMFELQAQMQENGLHFDNIVFASSSGGTQAGLTVGQLALKLPLNLEPISIDQSKLVDESIGMTYQQFVLNIAVDLIQKLSLDLKLTLREIPLHTDFLGDGYGVVGDLEREAIYLLARTEGILVDPVYSGRALGGLIARSAGVSLRKGLTCCFGIQAVRLHCMHMSMN